MTSGVVVAVSHDHVMDAAIGWAAAEAGLRQVRLTLLHAWSAEVDVDVQIDVPLDAGAAARAIAHAVPGPPLPALLAERAELLVVAGRDGARPASHLTRALVRQAACPVVVVPPGGVPEGGDVVVGVSGSATSAAALRWAAREAALRSARLVVVHAWQVHPHRAGDLIHVDRVRGLQQAQAGERLRGWLAELAAEAPAADVSPLPVHGAPMDVLLAAAGGAALLVVGATVHAGLDALIHPSIGHDLSQLASCPVALVPRTSW